MFKRFFDSIWNNVLYPIADFFWPANDCAICYFWRAFFFGAACATFLIATTAGAFVLGLVRSAKV